MSKSNGPSKTDESAINIANQSGDKPSSQWQRIEDASKLPYPCWVTDLKEVSLAGKHYLIDWKNVVMTEGKNMAFDAAVTHYCPLKETPPPLPNP